MTAAPYGYEILDEHGTLVAEADTLAAAELACRVQFDDARQASADHDLCLGIYRVGGRYPIVTVEWDDLHGQPVYYGVQGQAA